MANLNGFNANNVDPTADFNPIPAGKYLAVITDSEMRPTKSGSGHYLEFTFQVIEEGPHKGRRLWSRLNLVNPSAQAVGIAQAELSAVCRAVGHMQPVDSSELHDVPLVVIVGHKTRNDTGEIVNEIRGYAKADAADGDLPQQREANTPPWARR
jgi:hypothetical protein